MSNETTQALTHGALICVAHVRPHPNADRLQLAQVGGFQVVVGLNTKDGDLVCFFSSELEISAEFAEAHDLIQYKDPETGENKGGYFPRNRKVRPQRFRGERSDGYICPLDDLAFTGGDISTLRAGDLIDTFNDVPICRKYVNPNTKSLRAQQGKARKQHPDFLKHVDTEQLGYHYQSIKPGSLITVTAKMHGTSGRTGLIMEQVELKRTLLDKILRRSRSENQWIHLTGTRNVVLDNNPEAKGWYADESFRTRMSSRFQDQLHRGETVYYEIVGWVGEDTPVMAPFDLSDSKEFKKWGKGYFSYGTPKGTCEVYVYRITRQTTDANGMNIHEDLPFWMVQRRSAELGLKTVLPLDAFIAPEDPEELLARVMPFVEGAEEDFIDPSHPREGVVVRVDNESGTRFFKSKSLVFRVAEGITKEAGDVDLEEIS